VNFSKFTAVFRHVLLELGLRLLSVLEYCRTYL